MAWIRVIQPPEADERLRDAYEEVGAARGTVANIMKIHSVSPGVMSAHLTLYKRLMFGPSDLSRRQRETIGVVVSGANDCHYWIEHHGEALRRLGVDERTVAALAREPESVELDDATNAIVRYAIGLTRRPGTTSEDDVRALRAAGLSDGAVHDAATITAYFNFVNRTASGLGVELEGSRGAESADSPD